MKINNVDIFADWVTANCRYEYLDLNEWVSDLEKTIGETGTSQYEMRCFDSKSGQPVLIDFDKEIIELGEDEFETVITFF